jgi:hypothetical protein
VEWQCIAVTVHFCRLKGNEAHANHEIIGDAALT